MAKQPTNPPPGPRPPAPPAPPRKRSAHAELPAGILEQTIKLTRLASCPVCNGRLTSEKSDGARETCVRCEQSDTSHPKPACLLCGGSGQVRNAPLRRYDPCPKCFSFAAMLADVDAKTHVSASSLWGAPQRTTPTPFDAITPEMLEGVTLTRADTDALLMEFVEKARDVTTGLNPDARQEALALYEVLCTRMLADDRMLHVQRLKTLLDDSLPTSRIKAIEYARKRWQLAAEAARAQRLDITAELDQMARALSVLQETKP